MRRICFAPEGDSGSGGGVVPDNKGGGDKVNPEAVRRSQLDRWMRGESDPPKDPPKDDKKDPPKDDKKDEPKDDKKAKPKADDKSVPKLPPTLGEELDSFIWGGKS